jgi:hypothetical protein
MEASHTHRKKRGADTKNFGLTHTEPVERKEEGQKEEEDKTQKI